MLIHPHFAVIETELPWKFNVYYSPLLNLYCCTLILCKHLWAVCLPVCRLFDNKKDENVSPLMLNISSNMNNLDCSHLFLVVPHAFNQSSFFLLFHASESNKSPAELHFFQTSFSWKSNDISNFNFLLWHLKRSSRYTCESFCVTNCLYQSSDSCY